MIGKTLAHYEITDLIGQGGMGEVYRAHDTKLGRDVAIKVLHADTSGDPERIARFQREARTLATLQHTNVASIYGFEEIDGVRFLVMELVEGEDLSQRLAPGAVPMDEAVVIARQIASGLEAAHDQGIVHRDLKPANVKVAPDGHVKILDFGLARAYLGDPGETSDPMHSPTITAGMTQAGVVLGTAAYMSPEQARGKPVDRRADIWAFGVLVFEMVSGQRLFAGETVSDTLAGVLKTDIDLSQLPRGCPASLRRLLARCLDRESSTRLRDIGEARIILEQPMDSEADKAKSASGGRNRFLAFGGVAGLILGAILVWALAPSAEAPRPEREIQFSIPRVSLTAPRSEISPDGTEFLYLHEGSLWVREFRLMEGRPVPGTEGALVCCWSPDGEWIAFTHQSEIFKVRPDGSNRTRICEFASDMHPWAGSVDWTEDGRVVFATGDAGLFSVSEAGGDIKVLLPPKEDETDFHHVHVLPGDRGFLFHPHIDLGFNSIDIYTGTERRELLSMDGQSLNCATYGAGHIMFMRAPDNPGIWAVPFSLETLDVTGEPFLLIADATFPSTSLTGDLTFVPRSRLNVQVVRLDANGLVTEEIGDHIQDARDLAISPDGREAAIIIDSKNNEVWILDIASGDRHRSSFRKDALNSLSWGPRGEQLIISAGSSANMHQEIMGRNGSATSVVDQRGQDPVLTRDGRTLVLTVWDDANGQGIGYVDLDDPDLEPTMIADSSFEESNPVLSPDGRFVAYESLETGRREIVVRSFPDGKGRWDVSREGGHEPLWSPEGDRLYFMSLSNDWLHSVDVIGDTGRFGSPRHLFQISSIRDLSAQPDGGFLAMRVQGGDQEGTYDIWLNWASRVGR